MLFVGGLSYKIVGGVLAVVVPVIGIFFFLIPGGIRSLAAEDAKYRGRYTGDEDTSRKPAYHNGTVWGWTFPLQAEAMVKTAEADPNVTPAMLKRMKARALSLLASSVENFREGAVAHLSENADGDAPHHQKGSPAQAWSESELLRVWLICR